jgi:hypothetical protein
MGCYAIPFDGVNISAAQDLFEIKAPADGAFELDEVHVTSKQEEMLRIRIKRVTGSPTSGSGGSIPTPEPLGEGGVAATVTAEANNTTKMTGGTSKTLHAEYAKEFHYMPTREGRVSVKDGSYCVVELVDAPASAADVSGVVVVHEMK